LLLVPFSSTLKDKATTVQKGEKTLAQIAKRLGVPEEDLIAANPDIADPRNLKVGRRVRFRTRFGEQRISFPIRKPVPRSAQ
jgi:hypothetical protein